MSTYHIHINGIVQGVGFRPFVHGLARTLQLCGYVCNDNDGVHIVFNTTPGTAQDFYRQMISEAPAGSRIHSSEMTEIVPQYFSGFSIHVANNHDAEKRVWLSPDMAICGKCRSELFDKSDRRYRYPFITCAQCGPRYSIIESLPYERHHTAMSSFVMCGDCRKEYDNTDDRRFFSQTNSCADCGIQLRLHSAEQGITATDSEEILRRVNTYLTAGKIIAVKGIGGYLLLCDAANATVIQTLRHRKHRPAKPFALLYPDITSVQAGFHCGADELALLQSHGAPIVLLYPAQNAPTNPALQEIAPGLSRLGVMLPCSPLLALITADFAKPLIATSANISGSPILFKDEEALAYLFDIADYTVSYNRDILIPQDDSVLQVTRHSRRKIILRRSRGYAPVFLDYKPKPAATVFAAGALLKSSFALSVAGNVFISQFLGSGESYEAQEMYAATVKRWLDVYHAKPTIILADLHPAYFSHHFAKKMAARERAGLHFIQHHEAHFAAVLAEHGLCDTDEEMLGVIWDGTGLGSDGNIWGGEFFTYQRHMMERRCHLQYFPSVAGDKMALEPRISALCMMHDTDDADIILKEKFTDAEWANYSALLLRAKLRCSSIGRLFDAVASLLGLCDKQSYEGEAALYVQALAEQYIAGNGFRMNTSYFPENIVTTSIPTGDFFRNLMNDIFTEKAQNYIAAKVHYSLVKLIEVIARNTGAATICCSGGVFQNALLVDWIMHELGGRYRLCFHQNLSPNDENISFGQLAYYDNGMMSSNNVLRQNYVTPQKSISIP